MPTGSRRSTAGPSGPHWGGWGVAVPSPQLPSGCPWPLHSPRVQICTARHPKPCAPPSLCLLCEEQELGNGNCQRFFKYWGRQSFYSTSDQKKTQILAIQRASIKQTNWSHEDIFLYYSSFIYSSNNFHIPNLQKPRRKTENWPLEKGWKEKFLDVSYSQRKYC